MQGWKPRNAATRGALELEYRRYKQISICQKIRVPAKGGAGLKHGNVARGPLKPK